MEFILENHDQVGILVGLCSRHAVTTSPAHSVAIQGTHLYHTETAASVNHKLRELHERSVALQRMEHFAGGPNAAFVPQR